MRRFLAFFTAFFLLLINTIEVYACDENQSNTHVTEIMFGDDAVTYASNDNVKLLLNGLYLCSEQSDKQGQSKIDYLKARKVSSVPQIDDINIKGSSLIDCSHISWNYEYLENKKVRSLRKEVLQNTVNKVFDFGTWNNLFGSKNGKCNSFAALLYYSHILSDYLSDDPQNTETVIDGKGIPSYSGQPYIDINGGRPSFSENQKNTTVSFVSFSPLDSYGRCGIAMAVLGKDTIAAPNSRPKLTNIKPTGWNMNKYPGIVNSEPPYIYNRCHLIAHHLAGYDGEDNLITGTRYLNETGMKPFETLVGDYIEKTNNHVVYRAIPIFKGDNLVASGVQIEAYSVEDNGKGICFNVYCYNVQPGIEINYITGKNETGDFLFGSDKAIPFAVSNPSDSNPDLIYELNKHFEVLFDDQKKSSIYTTMMGDINSIAYEARSLGKIDEKPAKTYMEMKKCEYNYYQTLKMYVPMLLKNEPFFSSTFKR